MVQINWTDDAKDDLNNIFQFISKESEYYAELTIVKILERVDMLYNNVNIGKIIREKQDSKFREILYKQYRVMYKVIDENRVDILNVFHAARNFDLNLK